MCTFSTNNEGGNEQRNGKSSCQMSSVVLRVFPYKLVQQVTPPRNYISAAMLAHGHLRYSQCYVPVFCCCYILINDIVSSQ